MTTSGWAIKYTYTDVDRTVVTGFLGTHYFVGEHCSGCGAPDSLSGYRTAVFKTRQLAREAARVAGRGYDHATAVKVYVTVFEQYQMPKPKRPPDV